MKYTQCSNRRLVITIPLQGVFEVDFDNGLTLIEIADGVSVEDIKAATKCSFKVNMCA